MSENPASAYDMSHIEEDEERRTLAIIVDNEPGVLGRVVGLVGWVEGRLGPFGLNLCLSG